VTVNGTGHNFIGCWSTYSVISAEVDVGQPRWAGAEEVSRSIYLGDQMAPPAIRDDTDDRPEKQELFGGFFLSKLYRSIFGIRQ